jgi:protein-tyrosine phosphatase
MSPGRTLGLPSVPNLRDLGGYPAADGLRVRRGLVFRSDQLNPVSPDDLVRLAALGLKHDFDLRTAAEVAAKPDQLPPDVRMTPLDVLADAEQVEPSLVARMLRHPAEANAALGDGKVASFYVKTYREFVTLPSACRSYGALFNAISRPEARPCLFHCTTGKDRTGWAAAALLTLLGVPAPLVLEDYLRSNEYVLPHYRGTIDRFAAAGGDPAILEALFGVEAAYLDAAFDEVRQRHESVDGYFSTALGVGAEAQAALRQHLLERR